MAARMEDQKEVLLHFMRLDVRRTTLPALWKKSRMMTRYLLSWKKTGTLILEILRSSCQNPKLFKPFEMFVSMYGLPAHNEMDPTMFVGLTYSFIFGVMFGDVGQGLLLMIGGGLSISLRKRRLRGLLRRQVFFPRSSDFCLEVFSDLKTFFRRCGYGRSII